MATGNTLEGWVFLKLAPLEEQYGHLTRNREQLLVTLSEIEDELRTVEIGMAMYRELLKDAATILTKEQASRDDLPTPTDAVSELVASEPGIKRSALLDRLATRVKTSSEDPKSVLSAAVSRGKKDKRYEESDNGRVWPFDHEEAEKIRQQRNITRARMQLAGR